MDPSDALSTFSASDQAERAASFGGVASHYERYRPGPPIAAVDWFLPAHVGTVVDLGAGTGALTRLLIAKADEVVAVEPDDRMRSVLIEAVPTARAVKGTGESMPIPDQSADVLLASSSWHWMDPIPTPQRSSARSRTGRDRRRSVVRTGPRRPVHGPGPRAAHRTDRDRRRARH